VLAAFVAEAQAAPEELSTIANVMAAPPLPFVPTEHGPLVIMATLAYAGDLEAGERAVALFRALAEAYPRSTWERLAAIKGRYDPTNLFRRSQNIPPTKADPNDRISRRGGA
jgi:Berberine and berberine like